MSLQFIMGGSGSGKTRRLYEDLIRMSMEEPETHYFAIVPEQFTMQTQKEIVTLHPRHGVMNIDIVSFQRLAYRIFEELAVETPSVLDDMGKSMVLRKVASVRKKELKLFAGHLEKAGFVEQLKSMISELYQYGVTPQLLREKRETAKSSSLRHKLGDLEVLFTGFMDYIAGKSIVAEEILDVLCRELPKSELIKNSVVTLDGYTGFTPVQYRLLELFCIHCKKVTVTVTIDPRSNPYRESQPQNLFHMSKHTVCRLVDIAVKNRVTKEEDIILDRRPAFRFLDGDALDFLERELFRYQSRVYDRKQDQIFICQAMNPQKEVEYLTEQIAFLIQKKGLRFRDMAVVTGDLEGYSNEICRQFGENRIPFFIDDKKSILGNPMVELIRAALEVLTKNFSYESMFRYLKTGLVLEDREEMERLENYVVALGIRSFKRWNSQWEFTYRGSELLNLDQLNACRLQVLEPLARLREAFREKEATVRDMTAAVAELLAKLLVEQKMMEYESYFSEKGEHSLAKEYGQVYGLVMDLFDKLVALLGDEAVGKREYGDILDAGFEEIQVGLIPATVDRLMVGDITRSRLDHIKVLFLIGVNDGIVPSSKERGGVLTDGERRYLKEQKLELAPTTREDGFMQRFYLYLMMTKPEQRLYLSYSGMSAQGKSLRPSSLIAQVKKMFPQLTVIRQEETGRPPLTVAAGKRRLIAGIQNYGESCKDPHFLELYRLFFASDTYHDLVEKLVNAAFYTYEGRGIERTAAKALYGAILNGSVTRLEKYESCPYSHFLRYGLELMERQEYELAAVDIGNLFHRSIDLFFKEMKAAGRKWKDLTREDRKGLVRECVDKVTEEYGNTIMKSSARYTYLSGKVERITDRTIWAISEQLKKGDFEPEGFEISFSAVDNLKAMRIPLGDGAALHLKGRIDRLDVCEDQDKIYVKIIDYKSGSTKFDLVDLYYGLQLQLVVYMDAVLEMAERKNPEKQVIPAGIFYYNISDPMVERQPGMTREEIDREILRQLRMNGLVNSSLDAISHLDREIEKESDVIPVAFRDGIIQEMKSSVAGGQRFEHLRGFVNQKLSRIGREILDGKISVTPYKRGDRTACDYCSYHGVCGFDLKTEGFGYKRLKGLKSDEIWKEIQQSGQSGQDMQDVQGEGGTDGGKVD